MRVFGVLLKLNRGQHGWTATVRTGTEQTFNYFQVNDGTLTQFTNPLQKYQT